MRQIIFLFFLLITNYSYSQDGKVHYNKASELLKNGDNQAALVQISKALKMDSLNVEYLIEKGEILLALRKYQESYDTYSMAISIDPTNVRIFNNRGILLQTIQQFDEAIDDYTSALNLATVDSVRNLFLVNRAAAKIYKRDFNSAYDDLITVYKRDSSNIAMLTNLASICDEIGKGDETLKYLIRVVQIDSTFFPAYGNIGFKYQDMGDYKEAIKYFDKVLQLKPDEALGYSNRSFNKYKLGDYVGAIKDIERSIQLYPDNSYAYRIRALIYIDEHKIELGCKDLKKALDLGFTKMYGDEVNELQKKYCNK